MMQILFAVIVLVFLGLFLGLVLGYAAKILEVKKNPNLDKVIQLLPGYNCGSCGYPGCAGMAKALLDKDATIEKCRPSKPEQKKAINEFLESIL